MAPLNPLQPLISRAQSGKILDRMHKQSSQGWLEEFRGDCRPYVEWLKNHLEWSVYGKWLEQHSFTEWKLILAHHHLEDLKGLETRRIKNAFIPKSTQELAAEDGFLFEGASIRDALYDELNIIYGLDVSHGHRFTPSIKKKMKDQDKQEVLKPLSKFCSQGSHILGKLMTYRNHVAHRLLAPDVREFDTTDPARFLLKTEPRYWYLDPLEPDKGVMEQTVREFLEECFRELRLVVIETYQHIIQDLCRHVETS